jgi:hypothetical protein
MAEECGAISEGFNTTQFPAAIACAAGGMAVYTG